MLSLKQIAPANVPAPDATHLTFFIDDQGVPRVKKADGTSVQQIGATGAQGPPGTQGIQGVKGDMGATGLVWRSAWAAGTAYAIDDAVSKGGSSFFAVAPSTGVDPETDSGTYWQPLSLHGATGATGDAGAAGLSVLNGTGAPTGAVGRDGEFYIANDTKFIYGPKAAGTWPAGVSLIGPQGIQGTPGAAGATGAAGAAGATGATGAAGTNGLSLRHGTGAPANGVGVDGEYYISDDTHLLYGPKAAGVWPSGVSLIGPAGAAGAAGAGGSGAGGSASPRIILNDDCATATLPTTLASATAGITFDTDRLARVLTGGPYRTAPFAFNACVSIELLSERLTPLTNGGFDVRLVRASDAVELGRLTFQADGNIVIYATAAIGSAGQTNQYDAQYQRTKSNLVFNGGNVDVAVRVRTLSDLVGGQLVLDQRQYASAAIPNGTQVYVELVATATTAVALYGIRVFDGPVTYGSGGGSAATAGGGVVPAFVRKVDFTDTCDSLTNWATPVSGAWSSVGGRFHQESATNNVVKLRYGSEVAGVDFERIFRADIRLLSANQSAGDLYAGLLFGPSGSGTGNMLGRVQRAGGVWSLQLEQESVISVANSGAIAALAFDTDYTLTFVKAGTIYTLSLTAKGSTTVLGTVSGQYTGVDGTYPTLYSYGTTVVDFDNITLLTARDNLIAAIGAGSTAAPASSTPSSSVTVVSKSANYTMAPGDGVVLASGTITVTLPPVATAVGRYTIKNAGTGTITISPASGTIDGVATKTLAVQYSSEDYVTDGTNWFTV